MLSPRTFTPVQGVPDQVKVKKADRGFSPDPEHTAWPGVKLTPSDLGISQRIYDHFAQLRSDRDGYGRRFEDYMAAQNVERAKKLAKMRAWQAKVADTPYRKKVRASELKTCARQQAMRLMGFFEAVSESAKPQWTLAAASGDQWHTLIADTLSFMHLSKRAEFSVYYPDKDGVLSGRVDHELDEAILDVKTVDDKTFKEGAWGEKIKGFIAQVSVYARLTNKPRGIILLVNRNNGELLDLQWDVDLEYADKMLLRAELIVGYAEARKLPKAEAYTNGKPDFVQCGLFCPFREFCAHEEATGELSFRLKAGEDPAQMRM